MVREATITQEQVNAAADTLRAAGQKPTVRAVRERLGGGSNATVMRLLAVWQGGQVKPTETPPTLPQALQHALLEYVRQAVAEGKVQVDGELVEAQQVNADLVGESERQAAEIEALGKDLEGVQSDRDALAGRLVQLEADLLLTRGEVEQARAAAEVARTELAKAQLRLEAMPRLEADLATMRAELETERAGRVAAEQAAAVTAARLEAESAARTRVDAELQALAKREASASARAVELADQLASERAARQSSEVQRDDLREQLAEVRQLGNQVRSQLEARQTEAAELRGQLAALKSTTEQQSTDGKSRR